MRIAILEQFERFKEYFPKRKMYNGSIFSEQPKAKTRNNPPES